MGKGGGGNAAAGFSTKKGSSKADAAAATSAKDEKDEGGDKWAVKQGADILLRCYIQPGASVSEVCGEHDNAVKIRIASPPVDGKANKELTRVLADEFRVPGGAVTVITGQTSRTKRVKIERPAVIPAWCTL